MWTQELKEHRKYVKANSKEISSLKVSLVKAQYERNQLETSLSQATERENKCKLDLDAAERDKQKM